MTDTSPTVEAELSALYRRRSPGARLRMATTMFTSAKRLAAAGLRTTGGDLPMAEVRSQLLERLYGDELSAGARAWIAEHPSG